MGLWGILLEALHHRLVLAADQAALALVPTAWMPRLVGRLDRLDGFAGAAKVAFGGTSRAGWRVSSSEPPARELARDLTTWPHLLGSAAAKKSR